MSFKLTFLALNVEIVSSRVPQIFKNTKTKCAGLSLALFIFAVLGNVTYVLVRVRSPTGMLARTLP